MGAWRRLTAAVAAVVLAGCGGAAGADKVGGTAGQEAVTLTMAQPNEGSPSGQLAAWADEVRRRSGGTVTIEFQNGWRAGDVDYETATIEDVRAGDVDLAWVGARAFDRVGVTSFQALLAPLLVDSYDLQERVFEEGIPQQMLEGVETIDLVGIGILPGPMRKVLGVSQPFVTPDDFAGNVVGMQDSALAEATLQALGAAPRAVPTSARLDGLDAYEQQLSSIAGNHYQDAADHLTVNVNLWPRPLTIVAGRQAFASLSAEQQDLLKDAAEAAVPDAVEASRAEDDTTVPALCQSGLTFATASEADLAALRSALEPVYGDLEADPDTAEFLMAIRDLKDALAAPAEASTCEAAEAASDEGFPEGTFEMVLDGEEFARCGEDVPADEIIHELEVKDGAMNMLVREGGRSAPPETGWTGTYRVFRDHVELQDAMLTMTARWSFDGRQLRFTELTGGECGDDVVWATHPWVLQD